MPHRAAGVRDTARAYLREPPLRKCCPALQIRDIDEGRTHDPGVPTSRSGGLRTEDHLTRATTTTILGDPGQRDGRYRWLGRWAAWIALGAVGLFSTLTPAARANSYEVDACYAGQGTYLNPGDSAASWTLSDNNGSAYYDPYDQCGATSNGLGVISRSGDYAPTGDYGEVYFQAPPGLHIRQVQLWRSLIDYGTGSGGNSLRSSAEVMADGELPGVGDEFDGSADVPYGAAGSGDTTDNGIVPSNYLNMDLSAALPSRFAYVIGCPFSGCPTGGNNPDGGFDTVISIYGAIVSVEDDTPPTLTLGNTGLLNGGVQSGTVPLFLSASATAGIEKIEIFAGGSSTPTVTQDFTQTSNCEFWETVPCQNLQNYEYPVDTTALPNGTYYMTVKAFDPAGNVATVSSPSPVTIRNALAEGAGPAQSGSAARWTVSLAVTPRHVHQHSRIRLSGMVITAPRPPSGKLIYLQARAVTRAWRGRGRKRRRVAVYGPWITFHVLNAKPDGQFRAVYTFKLGGDHRYQMQAVAPAEGGFANPTGKSAPVLVTES